MFLGFLFLLLQVGIASAGQFSTGAVNYELTGANILQTLPGASIPSAAYCAVKCSAYQGCKGANYRISDHTCYLLDMDYSSPGASLVCNENFTHWTMNASAMPIYIPSKQIACSLLNNACPKPYHICATTCVSQRWVASCQPKVYFNCLDAYNNGERRTGIYLVSPDGGAGIEVFCNMQSEPLAGGGGGYTTIYRRTDGSVNFNVNFATIQSFFGDLQNEFFIGADNLARLTLTPRELLFLMWPFEPDAKQAYARYTNFTVGNAATGYALHAAGFTSPTIHTDPLAVMIGGTLRTADHDDSGCVDYYGGPEWTPATQFCFSTNLMGQYFYGYLSSDSGVGMIQGDYLGYSYSFRSFEWRIK